MKKSTKSPIIALLDALDRGILRAWKVFRSLKFGIFLLALIGVVAIWGTMGFGSNAALGDNAIPMARTQVFEHPWFIALLVLFACNLIVSTWHVTKMSLSIFSKKEFRRSHDYYTAGSAPRAEIEVPGGTEKVRSVLKSHFTRAHQDGNSFFAHKGLLSRLGPTIVHAGMLLVIGAMVAKAVLIWNGRIVTEGRFIAAEGEEFSFISQPIANEQQITSRNLRQTPLDVWVKVLDFDEVKHPNSDVPAHFRSLVEVRNPETQKVTVAQLDMNHSLSIQSERYGKLQFHQAGYNPVPDGDMPRFFYEVRDMVTGERLAAADAHPGDRVRVGETELFLEADGASPGDPWRLYSMEQPNTPVARGELVGGEKSEFRFRAEEFYPDFRIDESTGQPVNASNQPLNAALRISILVDGRPARNTWLFHDPQLAGMMPSAHPRYDLRLVDVRVPPDASLDTVSWNDPGRVAYDIAVLDRQAEERLTTETLTVGQASSVYTYESAPPGAESNGDYQVRVTGPAQRFVTVLSVVNDPTVPYLIGGVGIILLGATMTFVFRYRALYALWDEKRRRLRLALIPRWGQSPVREEFDALLARLSEGAGKTVEPETGGDADEVAPQHETANPRLVRN